MKTPTQRASPASQSLAPTGATGTTRIADRNHRDLCKLRDFPGLQGGKTLLKISIFISKDPGH